MSEEERLSSAERLARLLEEHEASDERREEKLDDRIGKKGLPSLAKVE